ncbi:nuclear transport factor 2 family protein [Flavobacterium sp. 25HG05S-40]|uniref:nuclear transport factor 2 family protein n=1 Tax=Flavobacterium sp. 25HG05S-40 TaxID=3458682 RepID=UPI00404486DC
MKINKELVSEMEHKLLEAIKTSNVRILEVMLHNDLVFNIPNGQMVNKEMDLSAYKNGLMQFENLESRIEKIQLFDDTAIVISMAKITGNLLGNEVDDEFRYMRVWKFHNESLKVIGGSCHQLY